MDNTPSPAAVVLGLQRNERTWVIRCHDDDAREVECWLRDALSSGRVVAVVDVGHRKSRGRVTTHSQAALERGMKRRLDRLSRAEGKVLDLLADGLTNREIADELHLAHKTVKNYVSSLLRKLDMNRRSEAAVFAARLRDHRPLGIEHAVRGHTAQNAS